ncbi:MAG: TRAP transporter small permease [Pseudomonadota bacterium]
MSPEATAADAGPLARALGRAIRAWALLGAGVLAAVVLVNVWTVLGGLIGLPFAGDFELTQMGVAVAAFMFLPWCQLNGHNVSADVFTAGASARTQRALSAVGSALALGFAALLLWRMWLGMLDQKAYNLSSAILQVPVWWAYAPILLSLALLAVASAMTLRREIGVGR